MHEAGLADEVLIHGGPALTADDVVRVGRTLFECGCWDVALLLNNRDVAPLAPPDLLADIRTVCERGEIVGEIRRGEPAADERTLLCGEELLRLCEGIDKRHKGLVLEDDGLGWVHQRESALLIEVEEHLPERLSVRCAFIDQNFHWVQTIERGCIYIVVERDTLPVNLHLVERAEADVTVRCSFLHETHEKARGCEVLGIVIEAAEQEWARCERACAEVGNGGAETRVNLREEVSQLGERTRVWVLFAEIGCGNAVRVEGFNDKTRRIRIDLNHADTPFLIEDKVEAREPCRQLKGIRNAQIGQQLLRHIHCAGKVVRRLLKDLRRLAEDGEEGSGGRAELVVELLREGLRCVCRIAVGIVAVLDIGKDGGVKCVDVGRLLVCLHLLRPSRGADACLPEAGSAADLARLLAFLFVVAAAPRITTGTVGVTAGGCLECFGERCERRIRAVGHLREIHPAARVGKSVKCEIVRREGGEEARRPEQPYEVARAVVAKGDGSAVVIERGLRTVAVVEKGVAAVIGIRKPRLARIPLGIHGIGDGKSDVMAIDVCRAECPDGGKCGGENGGFAPYVFHAEPPLRCFSCHRSNRPFHRKRSPSPVVHGGGFFVGMLINAPRR